MTRSYNWPATRYGLFARTIPSSSRPDSETKAMPRVGLTWLETCRLPTRRGSQ
jgi:hypothetical protein